MIGFDIAENCVKQYIDDFLELPPLENEKEFIHVCNMQWAAEDLLRYLKEFWNEDFTEELISNYVDDARYRAEKYKDDQMGRVYKTAEETAREIMLYFV